MFRALRYVFDRVVKRGNLCVVDAAGNAHTFGDGTGRHVRVRLHDRKLERELVINPQLVLGEAYMRGRLSCEEGRIYDFLDLVLFNAQERGLPRWITAAERLGKVTKRVQQYNPVSRSRRNVAHHYDIDGRIYDLFLDSDRQYSCAYFEGSDDLEAAQRAKKRHIAAKLLVRPGQSVLDIGCGWGGLGLYLAKTAGADVTGITLSSEQLKIARDRARGSGLSHRARFEYEDYRVMTGTFDRVVSVGMFEHVGVNHYDTYFRKVHDLLKRDGVGLIHTIGRSDEPCATNPFIRKYIFPGGYIPALSEMLPAIERSGLVVTDVEILRLHYAETLRAWRENFLAHWDEACRIQGEEFCRMWEFYLAGSETGFRYQGLVVFQIQVARRQESVPLTRDYIAAEEERLRNIEQADLEPRRLAGE